MTSSRTRFTFLWLLFIFLIIFVIYSYSKHSNSILPPKEKHHPVLFFNSTTTERTTVPLYICLFVICSYCKHSNSILPPIEKHHPLTSTTTERTTVPSVQSFISSKSKQILFWTLHFQNFLNNNQLLLGKIECGAANHSCFVTTNRSLFMSSNAVVFHGEGPTFMTDLSAVHSLIKTTTWTTVDLLQWRGNR